MALLLVTFGESLAMNQQQYEYEVMRELWEKQNG